MSMAHSLELRVPLVDHQLASYLQALPGAWKVNVRTPKPLLLGALKRKLPNAIVHRRKQGFTMPFEHWLKGELRATLETTLMKRESPLEPVLETSAVHGVWQDFLSGRTSWSRPWSLYVLSQWCDAQL
jgi:asparagine synthase (glutamine-hydrolysing)